MNLYKITQNNLINPDLVAKLISKANFRKSDIIIDIGAGKGIITSELAKYSDTVIAIEVDNGLYKYLLERFPQKNILIINEDFINFDLPTEPFCVFANIPFNKTADILHKLLDDSSFLDTAYLVLQKEAACKFAGEQVNAPNTMMSILYGVKFRFSIEYTFKRYDFDPHPYVDTILLKIKRRTVPMIKDISLYMFRDFVTYIFNKSRPSLSKSKLFTSKQLIRFKSNITLKGEMKPSEVTLDQFIAIFSVISATHQITMTKGYYNKISEEQSRIQKVNRTRNDKSWRIKSTKSRKENATAF